MACDPDVRKEVQNTLNVCQVVCGTDYSDLINQLRESMGLKFSKGKLRRAVGSLVAKGDIKRMRIGSGWTMSNRDNEDCTVVLCLKRIEPDKVSDSDKAFLKKYGYVLDQA